MKFSSNVMWACGSTETAWECCLPKTNSCDTAGWPDSNLNSEVSEPCIELVLKPSALCRVSHLSRISCDASLSWTKRQRRFSLSHFSLSFLTCHHLSDPLDQSFTLSTIQNRKPQWPCYTHSTIIYSAPSLLWHDILITLIYKMDLILLTYSLHGAEPLLRS